MKHFGTLTCVRKGEESELRTPNQAMEVAWQEEPLVGERFTCFGKSLTPGGAFRFISTSPIVAMSEVHSCTPYGLDFRTESDSYYELRPIR